MDKPKQTISGRSDEADDTRLHANGEKAEKIALMVADDIEQRFRELNPDMPTDALLCAGCVVLLMHNLTQEIVNRAGAKKSFARWFFSHLYATAAENLIRASNIPPAIVKAAEASGVDVARMIVEEELGNISAIAPSEASEGDLPPEIAALLDGFRAAGGTVKVMCA